ncbi:hypothetical protein ESOMN_v1c06250 [Williamsoniiplasma somnilux]|uniref:RDD domain-containing protein n=1 Tax=Williamsoniiplasma somnilux TaxID=215578 RepID=A0A2K8NYZ4_9MOLU|nr:RDD family protein [Williamsoniiplasma somnilux]ATZ19007.1 hypothetical protein ESOMN_v1c06250 [Williamsoniiplasma somnilux]
MSKVKVNNSNSSLTTLPRLSKNNQIIDNPEKHYRLASIYKVMFARLFDLLLSAIPGIVINIVLMQRDEFIGNWGMLIGIIIATFCWVIIYFVVMPWFLKGQTLGKLLFNIRLMKKGENKKVTLLALFLREAYFNVVPWLIVVIAQIVSVILMSNFQTDEVSKSPGLIPAIIIVNISNLIYALWMGIVALTIKVQADHQAGIDMKLGLYVVDKLAIEDEIKIVREDSKMSRKQKHVSLAEQPGNFDQDMINDLYISESDEPLSSIYVEESQHLENFQIEQERKKFLEQKNRKDEDKDE